MMGTLAGNSNFNDLTQIAFDDLPQRWWAYVLVFSHATPCIRAREYFSYCSTFFITTTRLTGQILPLIMCVLGTMYRASRLSDSGNHRSYPGQST